MVSSTWKTAMFIDGNKEKLARDMSLGQGETLDVLAQLLGLRDDHKSSFYRLTKDNFATIFPSDTATTDEVLVELKQVLGQDAELSRYSTLI